MTNGVGLHSSGAGEIVQHLADPHHRVVYAIHHTIADGAYPGPEAAPGIAMQRPGRDGQVPALHRDQHPPVALLDHPASGLELHPDIVHHTLRFIDGRRCRLQCRQLRLKPLDLALRPPCRAALMQHAAQMLH